MNELEPTALHWMRPAWLIGLPMLVALAAWWWRDTARGPSAWDDAVDEALRPYVIEPSGRREGRGAGLALFAGWAVTVLILAGPVVERRPVPAIAAPASTVLVVDLSPSMRATDLLPDRITRARFRMSDLLDGSEDQVFGLVVFAERPYTVSPLTDDVETLRAFLPSLSPELAPVAGSRPDLALEHAQSLLDGAGVLRGRLLLVTDARIGDRDLAVAAAVRDAGHRVSVLGVGSDDGVPLRDAAGQFVERADGSIVIPRLERDGLQQLAASGGGAYVELADDGSDLQTLLSDIGTGSLLNASQTEPSNQRRWWIERGPWLLWPLAFAALWLFRREASSPGPVA